MEITDLFLNFDLFVGGGGLGGKFFQPKLSVISRSYWQIINLYMFSGI